MSVIRRWRRLAWWVRGLVWLHVLGIVLVVGSMVMLSYARTAITEGLSRGHSQTQPPLVEIGRVVSVQLSQEGWLVLGFEVRIDLGRQTADRGSRRVYWGLGDLPVPHAT